MKFTVILVFCFICSQNKAQNRTFDISRDTLPDHHKSYVGFYLGSNQTFTTNGGMSGHDKTFRSSFLYGAYGTFSLKGRWQIETGLGAMEYDAKYLRFGSSYIKNSVSDTSIFTDELITQASYVTIPVIFKYSISERSKLLAGIRGSGQFNNNLAVHQGFKAPGKMVDSVSYLAAIYYPPQNQFDVGLILGYEFNFTDRLFASLEVNLGMIPCIPKSYISSHNYSDDWMTYYFYHSATGNYNNSLSIRLCYSFLKY